jgi:hypothetical protein
MLGLFLSSLYLFHMNLSLVDRSVFELISVEWEVFCIFVCAIGPIEELWIEAQLGLGEEKHHLKRYTFLLSLHSLA